MINDDEILSEYKGREIKCKVCLDSGYKQTHNLYSPCPHCNREMMRYVSPQESYIMDFNVGEDDPECVQRELEDLGIIDIDTGKSIINNDNLVDPPEFKEFFSRVKKGLINDNSDRH